MSRLIIEKKVLGTNERKGQQRAWWSPRVPGEGTQFLMHVKVKMFREAVFKPIPQVIRDMQGVGKDMTEM